MSFKLFFSIIGFLIITALGVAGGYILLKNKNTVVENTKPQQKIKSNEEFLFYGWIPYWDQKSAMQSVYNNPEIFDKVGLFWYKLSEEGDIVPYRQTIEDRRFVEFAHQNNIKVLGLIANLPEDGESTDNWDPERVERVIGSQQARQQHIQDLVNLVVYNNFDGLALDYENLNAEQRNDFSSFVEELARALHEEEKTLEIAIHPKISDNPNEFQGALAQDYTRLSRAADKLHFMMYTQNGTHSQPAPSTTLEWSKDVLSYANSQGVPNEKIVFGVGLTGTHWQINQNSFEGTSSDLTYEFIERELQKKNSVNRIRDENTQSIEASFQEDNTFNVVWYADAKSIARMVEYAKQEGLSGVSFWRLGGEDPNIWKGGSFSD